MEINVDELATLLRSAKVDAHKSAALLIRNSLPSPGMRDGCEVAESIAQMLECAARIGETK